MGERVRTDSDSTKQRLDDLEQWLQECVTPEVVRTQLDLQAERQERRDAIANLAALISRRWEQSSCQARPGSSHYLLSDSPVRGAPLLEVSDGIVATQLAVDDAAVPPSTARPVLTSLGRVRRQLH